ncbi:MAG: hypothetical protein KGJ40_02360 [candidate division NC10 bacterium]|nr:hypothetical protein [candidate division NC10 bacterium]
MNRPLAAFGEQAFAYRDYLEGSSGHLRQEIAWCRVSTFKALEASPVPQGAFLEPWYDIDTPW